MFALAQHGRRLHRGVNFISRAIEEAGVDEHHAVPRGANAFRKVDAGAPLFVHDADFQGISR